MDPPRVCLAVDLVTYTALEEASVTLAPSLLILPLPEGSGSSLVSGPVLSGVGIRIGSLPLETVPSVLKGLLDWYGVVILSSLLMKVGRCVCRSLGMKNVIDSGVEPSGGVGSSRIRSAVGSSGLVCTMSIRAGR